MQLFIPHFVLTPSSFREQNNQSENEYIWKCST